MSKQIIKLDIGCGRHKRKGFIGIDILPVGDICLDVCKDPLSFNDEEVDEIYTCHTIEHFADFCFFIKECYRVLKPGGLLTIEYPHYTYYKAHNQYHKNYFSSVIMDFYDERSNIMKTKRLNEARFKIIKKDILVMRTWLLPYTYFISWIARFFPLFYETYLSAFAPAYNVRLQCIKI